MEDEEECYIPARVVQSFEKGSTGELEFVDDYDREGIVGPKESKG